MKELSLHILDIVQNSLKANATLIKVEIYENYVEDVFKITIDDNGCGMDEETLKSVTNPFFTTRATRKVGLGIPLLKEAAERCNGYFKISSTVGVGTKVECCFERSNIDRAPLGDISGTILIIMNSLEKNEFLYNHCVNDKLFEFSTIKIKEILEDDKLNSPDILLWAKEYIEESINELYN